MTTRNQHLRKGVNVGVLRRPDWISYGRWQTIHPLKSQGGPLPVNLTIMPDVYLQTTSCLLIVQLHENEERDLEGQPVQIPVRA